MLRGCIVRLMHQNVLHAQVYQLLPNNQITEQTQRLREQQQRNVINTLCQNTSTTVCSNIGYCSWINNACVDLQCSTIAQDKCTAEGQYYKCAWNSSSKACESKTYTCSDITTKSKCKTQYYLDCIWKSNQCVNFTCQGIDSDTCNPARCSNASGQCGDPQSVDCTTLTQTACANGVFNGSGKMCVTNDSGTCKEYNVKPQNCADYGDQMLYCSLLCSYDETAKTCSKSSCSKFKTVDDCTLMIDYYAVAVTPCYWTGTLCQDATDSQIQAYDLQNCLVNTMMHYAWNTDSQKCVACASFTSNPAYTSANYAQLVTLLLTVIFMS